MKNKILEFNLPAYWASYLINGDASGITTAEQAAIDTFCTAKGISGACVDCGESFFHHRNDANDLGGDVCQYTFLVPEKKQTKITFELPAIAAAKINENPEAFKAAMAAAGFPVVSVTVETEPARKTFSAMWSEELGDAIMAASLKPYPAEFHKNSNDWHSIGRALDNERHPELPAVAYTYGPGEHGRGRFTFNANCVPALVHRLMVDEDENSQSLASGICETLNIELI